MGSGNLFGETERAFLINIDGASRGNPGPSAAGWVIRDASDGQILLEKGLALGNETNNRAEYMALLFALEDAILLKADKVTVLSDSELLVKQMRREYRVKNHGLKGLFERAEHLAGAFGSFTIRHVPREENREADRAANEALNEEKRKTKK